MESATDGAGDIEAADQRRAVRERYGDIAAGGWTGEGCCDDGDGCCSDEGAADATGVGAKDLGYSESDVAAVEPGANLGLGCGNPKAIANLEHGEAVLDLGSGAGFDCFLAADAVGPEGRVVGVDMTPEMVERARENARENDADTVEFRLGEIEHLPVSAASIDVIISNCVVNLSPDKDQVFREAHRVLRPGGRLAVSDVVLTADLPEAVRGDPTSVAACVAGAATVEELEEYLTAAGFEDVRIEFEADSDTIVESWDDEVALEAFVASASITARKPKSGA